MFCRNFRASCAAVGTVLALAVSGVCLVLPASARAAFIDFEDLPEFTFVDDEYRSLGVQFSYPNLAFRGGEVASVSAQTFNVEGFGGSGDKVLHLGLANLDNGAAGVTALTFVVPGTSDVAFTDLVSFRAGDGDPAAESFRITAVNRSGGILFTQDYSTTSGPIDGGVDVVIAASGVSTIFLEHLAGSGFAIDDVTFNTPMVPIPATLPLFLSAIGGLGFVGWRRHRLAA